MDIQTAAQAAPAAAADIPIAPGAAKRNAILKGEVRNRNRRPGADRKPLEARAIAEYDDRRSAIGDREILDDCRKRFDERDRFRGSHRGAVDGVAGRRIQDAKGKASSEHRDAAHRLIG